MHAFRYFVNNLAPGLRSFWIHFSDRVRVDEFMRDDLFRLTPEDVVPLAAGDAPKPRAVVLDLDGVLLGAIERTEAAVCALDLMDSNPQTIRPDMPPRLAKKLLKSNPYLMVTTEKGKYLGRYVGS